MAALTISSVKTKQKKTQRFQRALRRRQAVHRTLIGGLRPVTNYLAYKNRIIATARHVCQHAAANLPIRMARAYASKCFDKPVLDFIRAQFSLRRSIADSVLKAYLMDGGVAFMVHSLMGVRRDRRAFLQSLRKDLPNCPCEQVGAEDSDEPISDDSTE